MARELGLVIYATFNISTEYTKRVPSKISKSGLVFLQICELNQEEKGEQREAIIWEVLILSAKEYLILVYF